MLRRVSLFVAAALLVAGCGDSDAEARPPGAVNVFAATSLTNAFTELGRRFEARRDGVRVTLNFAASSALVQQLAEGAPADVVALADRETMQRLRERGAVLAPRVFARNRLVIATKAGNPAAVRGLRDLASVGVVSLCGGQVPCGKYADAAIVKAGVSLPESKVTRAPNVSAALAAVTEGDAGAAIVYATDARAAGDRVTAVTIAEDHNVIAAYPVALTRRATSAAARAFFEFVLSGEAHDVLRAHGFLAA